MAPPSRPTIRRSLATLLKDDQDDQDESLGMQFIPSQLVLDMHHAPRFGHSNRLGILASYQKEETLDYASGLKQFTLFWLIPFILWGLLLIAFKFIYGKEKVGCAAGGSVIDIRKLSKSGVRRKTRKAMIMRNWKVQACFLMVAIIVPTVSLLLMRVGWPHLDTAFQEVASVLEDVESWSYKGVHIVNHIQKTHQDLQNHSFVQKSQGSTSIFDEWCPQSATKLQNQPTSDLAYLKDSFDQVQHVASTLETNVESYLPSDPQGFQTLTEISQHTSESINWFLDNEWVFKMFLMVLNVINLLLLLVCYCFSKNNLIHPPTRAFTTWLLLPVFIVLTFILMATTAVAGIATLFNADFCAGGGDLEQSPQGTLRDAIFAYQHGSLSSLPENQQPLNGSIELAFETFVYYSNGCLTDHPLAFLESFSEQLNDNLDKMNPLVGALSDAQGFNRSMTLLSQECGTDFSYLPQTISSLQVSFQELVTHLNNFIELTSCHQVSPMIRRLTHGAICDESAKGVTWVFASCFTLLGCCFTMLSVRAALFNSIKSPKPRDKKPKRVVEKEFDEYKEYMAEFYGEKEVAEWKLRGSQKQKVEFDLGSHFLRTAGTFETDPSTPDSDQGGIFKFDDSEEVSIEDSTDDSNILSKPLSQDMSNGNGSYESSYESCSDDSNSDDNTGDDKSALLNFFVETKSMAKQGLENVKDMGMHFGDNIRDLGSVVGGPVIRRGNDNDDRSVSSFWSGASSLVRQTARRVVTRTLPALLGSTNAQTHSQEKPLEEDKLFLSPLNFDDPGASQSQDSRIDSISMSQKHGRDDKKSSSRSQRSTRPNVASRGGYRSKEALGSRQSHKRESPESEMSEHTDSSRRGAHGIWRLITPTATSHNYTSSRKKRSKTPMAPKKKFQFLARTSGGDFNEQEMQPLSPNRSSLDGRYSLDSQLQPIHLRLSPFAGPSDNNSLESSSLSTPRQRRRQRPRPTTRTRLALDEDDDEETPPTQRTLRFLPPTKTITKDNQKKNHPKSTGSGGEKSFFFKL